MNIWSTDACKPVECGGEWRIDCHGFNNLLTTKTHIWGGANNGSIYVWDIASHYLIRELAYHSDSVRSLLLLPDGNVVSGSGSGDGTIAFWKEP